MSKGVHISFGELSYPGKDLCVDVSLDINPGECILLCGANGSGKTTLLRRIVSEIPDQAVFVPSRIQKVRGFTLDQFIHLACSNGSRTGKDVCEAMELMNLTGYEDRDISTLSDGEFQKACICAALAGKKDIILLDEPTAFLDTENRLRILSILRKICDGGSSVMFSSHDIHCSLEVCDKVYAIGADKHIHCGKGEDRAKAAMEIFEDKSLSVKYF